MLEEIVRREAKLWTFVGRAGDDECWPWNGTRGLRDYGYFYLGKTLRVRAHRAVWMLHHGQEIPEGKVICHSCDNPPCCNPAHLWLGTVEENNKDRARKGRTIKPKRDEANVPHLRGTSHPASKFTEAQVLSIRDDPRSLSTLAAIHHVNQATISKIKRRQTYPLVGAPLLRSLPPEPPK